GEEFPDFRVFWIEKPAGNGKKFRIHALLDGPSLTGAYRFDVTPGKQTVIKVKAVLFPRRKIATIGLAPLTSMFLLGPSDPVRVSDYRPHVHDSGGLAILTSERERIWRPLANPRNLQMSAFLDRAVRGFGLIQRNRNYASFLDLEARYHKRPSVWVNFDKSLGNGRIVLVEIPTENEFHDNIVAFWRPEKPVAANNALRFNYTMYWSELPPWHGSIPWVASTRSGLAHLKGGKTAVRFVVEYRWLQQYSATQIPKLVVTASRGRIQAPTVQRNPQTGGLRVTFLFHPGKEGIADLRANLGAWNGRTPETWIYRWNR
ncbi:MAG: glucan biosynthesis protein, partial [Beijerinckiaceae bacterium]